jgi:hypothetical protein
MLTALTNSMTQIVKQDNVVNWYLNGMHDGEISSTLVLFSREACFQLGGYVDSQNNRLPRFIDKVSVHDVKADVWHSECN